MRLGLIGKPSTKSLVEKACKGLDITFYEEADFFFVESGYETEHMPCFVFRPEDVEQVIGLIQRLRPIATLEQIVGQKEETFHIIKTEEILFFEARDSIVYFRTSHGEYRMNEKLFEVEKRLPTHQFIRISRSYVVNIKKVATIAPWFSRRLLLTFEKIDITVEVSRSYVQSFKEFLGMR